MEIQKKKSWRKFFMWVSNFSLNLKDEENFSRSDGSEAMMME